MTQPEAREALTSSCTHKLVREVVALCGRRDPVDAVYDLLLAAEIVRALSVDLELSVETHEVTAENQPEIWALLQPPAAVA